TTSPLNGAWQFTTENLTNTTHNYTATVTDYLGNISNTSLTVSNAINSAPVVTAINENPPFGTVSIGKTVSLTLTFSNLVNVGGAPTLSLNDGGTATYTSGSGTNILTFTYTVGTGQNTSALAITAVNLPNGASINDAIGSAASVVLNGLTQNGPQIDTNTPIIISDVVNANAVTLNGTAKANSTITVFDGGTQLGTATVNSSGFWSTTTGILTTGTHSFTAMASDTLGNTYTTVAPFSQAINVAPKLTAITDLAAGNDLTVGKTVTMALTFSNLVTVTGTPTLTLNDGGTATFIGGSGTNTLTFTYTVAMGDNASALAVTSFNLPGGATIKDAGGTAATLLLTGLTQNGPQIDTYAPIAPTITNSNSNANSVVLNGTAEAGSTVSIYDKLAEPGISPLPLSPSLLGTVIANSSGNWSFTTGTLADGVHNLTAIATDAAGNNSAASSSYSQPINVTALVGITESPANTVLAPGQTATLAFTFNNPVTVTGTPPSLFMSDNVWPGAVYSSGSGTNVLIFTYTIPAENFSGPLTIQQFTDTLGAITDVSGSPVLNISAFISQMNWNNAPKFAPGILSVSDVLNANNSITFTGTAPANTQVQIHDITGFTTLYGTVTSNASGAWSFTTSAFPQGTYGFTVVAGQLSSKIYQAVQTATTATAIQSSVNTATIGTPVLLTLSMSNVVNVTGNPTLTLNDGGTATYLSGSGTKSLVFSYIVAAGQNTPTYLQLPPGGLAVTSINLPNGATMLDGASSAVSLSVSSLTIPSMLVDTTSPIAPGITSGAGTSIDSSNLNIVVDSTTTGVSTISTTTPGTFKAGAVINISLTYSEIVVVTGTPTITLNDGGTATYVSGSGTTKLVFNYTVVAGQNASALALNTI
ncbi:MAG TPA: Ig-like domain-containing protein, partial [Candidatus Saccharimonadales bacterium]|nr:Ig-like domain-containing protein [Candidatus Saccharimonadales bacterium]